MSKSRIDRNVFGRLADALEVEYQANKAQEAKAGVAEKDHYLGIVLGLSYAKGALLQTTLEALALPKEVCEWAQDMAKQMGATHWKWSREQSHQWVRFYVLPPDDTDIIYTLYTLYESDGVVKDTKDDGGPIFQYRTYFAFSRGNGVKSVLATGELMPIEASIWDFQQQLLGTPKP